MMRKEQIDVWHFGNTDPGHDGVRLRNNPSDDYVSIETPGAIGGTARIPRQHLEQLSSVLSGLVRP
jgi:hypothetical protein